MELRTIENYFISLLIYSFIGWLYETIICSIEARRLVERGFLNGPYCPIYGVGAILDLLLLGWIENPIALFFAGMVLTTTLEYLTSYVMEKLFHARWWDYSDYRFNINGRVCLIGAVVFGLFSLLLIKVINPWMSGLLEYLPPVAEHIVSAVLLVIFVTDIVITLRGFSGFDEKLRSIASELDAAKERAADILRGAYEQNDDRRHGIADVKERAAELLKAAREREGDVLRGIGGVIGDAREKLETAVKEIVASVSEKLENALSFQQKRMLRSFPKLRSVNYNKTLAELREFLNRDKKK